jgi:hypothetical protein
VLLAHETLLYERFPSPFTLRLNTRTGATGQVRQVCDSSLQSRALAECTHDQVLLAKEAL